MQTVSQSSKISQQPVSKLEKLSQYREQFNKDLESLFDQCLTAEGHKAETATAARYALFSGGKRFRPLLAIAAGNSLDVSVEKVTPFAAAVEFVHTYSLIHDDLPCLDDDDFRRDQPTVHKKFNEATALLAGDLLLTEAPGIIARSYKDNPQVGLALVEKLVARAGGSGMILGQILDLGFSGNDADKLKQVHLNKTGGLISLCVEGAGIIAGCSKEQMSKLTQFGYNLGLSFQIKDDLLDADKEEAQSFIKILGLEETQKFLESTLEESLVLLNQLGLQESPLADLVHYNFKRDH